MARRWLAPPCNFKKQLVGGFNPFEKYARQNWIISPSRDKNKKCLKPPPRQWLEIPKISQQIMSTLKVATNTSQTHGVPIVVVPIVDLNRHPLVPNCNPTMATMASPGVPIFGPNGFGRIWGWIFEALTRSGRSVGFRVNWLPAGWTDYLQGELITCLIGFRDSRQ